MISKELGPAGAAPEFLEEFASVAQQARGALTELLRAAGAEGFSTKEFRQRLGLGNNLAWKLSKLVHGREVWEVNEYLPGPSGLRILLRAAQKAGAPKPALDRVRDALIGFDAMVARHSGDRASFDLMLSSSLADRKYGPQLEHRKQAFQANSAMWGVQAKTQIAVQIMAPNAEDPTRIDMAQLSGLVGFRRMRSDARWPLVRFHWELDPASEDAPRAEALVAEGNAPGGLPLFRRFCSDPLPTIESRAVEGGRIIELCEGPVGNTAAADCLVGTVMRRYAPSHSQPGSERETAQLFISLGTPVELALFDVYVHRDAAFPEVPRPQLISRLQLGAAEQGPPDWGGPMPLAETVQNLGSGPPIFATPLVPQHSEAVQAALHELGWSAEDFTGYRLAMSYPPIPTSLMLSCKVPYPDER